MQDRLGGHGNRYTLVSDLRKDLQPVITNRDGRVARFNILVTSHYTLKDTRTGKDIDRGLVQRRVGYDVVDSDYATFAAQSNATKLAVDQLAQEYELRLINLFNRYHP